MVSLTSPSAVVPLCILTIRCAVDIVALGQVMRKLQGPIRGFAHDLFVQKRRFRLYFITGLAVHAFGFSMAITGGVRNKDSKPVIDDQALGVGSFLSRFWQKLSNC